MQLAISIGDRGHYHVEGISFSLPFMRRHPKDVRRIVFDVNAELGQEALTWSSADFPGDFPEQIVEDIVEFAANKLKYVESYAAVW